MRRLRVNPKNVFNYAPMIFFISYLRAWNQMTRSRRKNFRMNWWWWREEKSEKYFFFRKSLSTLSCLLDEMNFALFSCNFRMSIKMGKERREKSVKNNNKIISKHHRQKHAAGWRQSSVHKAGRKGNEATESSCCCRVELLKPVCARSESGRMNVSSRREKMKH